MLADLECNWEFYFFTFLKVTKKDKDKYQYLKTLLLLWPSSIILGISSFFLQHGKKNRHKMVWEKRAVFTTLSTATCNMINNYCVLSCAFLKLWKYNNQASRKPCSSRSDLGQKPKIRLPNFTMLFKKPNCVWGGLPIST